MQKGLNEAWAKPGACCTEPYYDEFDDYEEAEEYYYEHGGW